MPTFGEVVGDSRLEMAWRRGYLPDYCAFIPAVRVTRVIASFPRMRVICTERAHHKGRRTCGGCPLRPVQAANCTLPDSIALPGIIVELPTDHRVWLAELACVASGVSLCPACIALWFINTMHLNLSKSERPHLQLLLASRQRAVYCRSP